MMNRSKRMGTRRRCTLRGGGFATTPASFFPTGGFMAPRETITYLPENGLAYARPGMLVNEPNPALAQTAMAGGRRTRRHRGGRRDCGCSRQRGGGGGALAHAPVGTEHLRMNISGNGGFGVDPSQSVGGSGPNVGAVNVPNGCYPSLRAGMVGGKRRKQRGGGGSTYAGADCYRATGSLLPMYPNPSAGFNQTPSTWSLPPGVANAFQIYNPVIARVGGGRKRRHTRKH